MKVPPKASTQEESEEMSPPKLNQSLLTTDSISCDWKQIHPTHIEQTKQIKALRALTPPNSNVIGVKTFCGVCL